MSNKLTAQERNHFESWLTENICLDKRTSELIIRHVEKYLVPQPVIESEPKGDGWIDCKDRMPDDTQVVDTWNGHANNRAVYLSVGNRFQRHIDFCEGDRAFMAAYYIGITHWRKLPSPPSK